MRVRCLDFSAAVNLCGCVGFPNTEKGREKNKLAKGCENVKTEFELAMPMWARFRGQTSCGFKRGRLYLVTIGNGSDRVRDKYIWVVDATTGRRRPYSSLDKMAENWEIPADPRWPWEPIDEFAKENPQNR